MPRFDATAAPQPECGHGSTVACGCCSAAVMQIAEQDASFV
jgi:hypothetical protein